MQKKFNSLEIDQNCEKWLKLILMIYWSEEIQCKQKSADLDQN